MANSICGRYRSGIRKRPPAREPEWKICRHHEKARTDRPRFGLSASITDINSDGWPDIYIANDFKTRFHNINNRNGTFTNRLSDYIRHQFFAMDPTSTTSTTTGWRIFMVLDMAVKILYASKQLFVVNQNYDKFELMVRFGFVLPISKNTLQLNNGDGTFNEIGTCRRGRKASGAGHPLLWGLRQWAGKRSHIQRNQTR